MKLSRRNFVKFLGCSAAMLALPNVSAMAVSKTTIGAPAEMVDVLVTEDTAHLIYASVPKSLAGEYPLGCVYHPQCESAPADSGSGNP